MMLVPLVVNKILWHIMIEGATPEQGPITAHQGHQCIYHQKMGGSGQEYRANVKCLVGRWTHPPG